MVSTESRVTPRISCTKLGEYMVSSPTRRRRIIQDQKWPSDFIVPLYTEAQEVIAGFVRRGATDAAIIERAIDRLLHAPTKSDWAKQKNSLCIDAVKSFMNVAPLLDLKGYTMRQTGNRQPKLKMAGVVISVRPELVVRYRDRNSDSAGAIKLYFAKGNPLNDKAANYVGTILHEFSQAFLEPRKTAKPRDCLLIDVFAETVFAAPRATKKRRKELDDACQEIAAVWNSIPEPNDRSEYRTRRSKAGTLKTA